jgi:hypothetical protein
MSKTPTEESDIKSETSRQLLEQIKGLLVLQLRKAGVDDTGIGNVIGLKAKTVRNRYPLNKKKTEDTQYTQKPDPATAKLPLQ